LDTGKKGREYGNTRRVPSLYHWRIPPVERTYPTKHAGMACLRGYMEIGYNGWMGHSVVLQVALGDIRVPLRGKLLKENSDSVRLRIGEGWDVDIYKAMIQAVEEDKMAMIPA